MSDNKAAVPLTQVEALLQKLRDNFVDELSERFDLMEDLTLALGQNYDLETFNQLYRETHSLKGSGGTHKLHLLSSICHHLENSLSEAETDFNSKKVNTLLEYIDLLRQLLSLYQQDSSQFSVIEDKLEQLCKIHQRERLSILIAESSAMMQQLYTQSLEQLPLQLTFTDNGINSLELLIQQKFDAIIISRELKQINGLGVISALCLSHGKNHKTPFFLITSNNKGIPEYLDISKVLIKTPLLFEQLQEEILELVPPQK